MHQDLRPAWALLLLLPARIGKRANRVCIVEADGFLRGLQLLKAVTVKRLANNSKPRDNPI